MKTTAIDVRQYFEPVMGTRPWRVKLGVGSFLTFEFGHRVKDHGHLHGTFHLWVYQSKWALFHADRQFVDSDSDRRVIAPAVRRLEDIPLTDVDFTPHNGKTTFVFDDFRLVVSPADYLDDPDERDHYWLFFMSNKEVLAVGPGGVRVEPSEGRNRA